MSFLNRTTTTTTGVSVSKNKKALCTGINKYPDPSNNLAGCVNDANDWAAFLRDARGFSVQTLVDSEVTSNNFKERAGNLITDAKAGDYITITYSGHGSNVKDTNGDEDDGRDECICLYDRFFIDDEIRELFQNINSEATLVFISDSCHSGTVTRAFLNAINNNIVEERLMPRFLPPMDDNEIFEMKPSDILKGSRIFYPEANMKEILISGCLPTEYSYDARINGRNNGAMTALALQILKSNPPMTFSQFYTSLSQVLPSSRYPQTPQLEGSNTNKNSLMFQ